MKAIVAVRASFFSMVMSFLPLAVECGGGPERPNSGFVTRRLPVLSLLDMIEQTEKHSLPRIPSKEPIDNFPARAHNLGRYIDDGVAVGREVHPQ